MIYLFAITFTYIASSNVVSVEPIVVWTWKKVLSSLKTAQLCLVQPFLTGQIEGGLYYHWGQMKHIVTKASADKTKCFSSIILPISVSIYDMAPFKNLVVDQVGYLGK